MQRRLTIALVGVALASVVLVGAGVLILAQIGARDHAEQQTIHQLDFLIEAYTDPADEGTDSGDNGRARIDRQNRLSGGRALLRAIPALGLSGANLAVVDGSGNARILRIDERGGRLRFPQGGEIVTLDEEELAALRNEEPVILDTSDADVVAIRAISLADERAPLAVGGETFALIARRPVVTVDRDARLWFLASAGLVLLGSLLASWLLARRFAGPLKEIDDATSAIAGGNLATRVNISGDDELAHLGHSVNRMAGDLERSKALDQQFLMSVSHDLRTPLTAITGYAEALNDGAVDDPARTGEIIGDHAGRLERLVGDLLDLARLDANRFQLDVQPVDAGVAVGRTVAGLVPRASNAGLDLGFESTGPSFVEADVDRLAQAVGNLIDNALKFANSMVEVSVVSAGAEVRISVVDDGPGIPAADLPFVFDRLYVAKSQPRRAENSSGIGLAIVAELIAAMGGTVEAESAGGDGTRMVLRLPAYRRSTDG